VRKHSSVVQRVPAKPAGAANRLTLGAAGAQADSCPGAGEERIGIGPNRGRKRWAFCRRGFAAWRESAGRMQRRSRRLRPRPRRACRATGAACRSWREGVDAEPSYWEGTWARSGIMITAIVACGIGYLRSNCSIRSPTGVNDRSSLAVSRETARNRKRVSVAPFLRHRPDLGPAFFYCLQSVACGLSSSSAKMGRWVQYE